MKVLSLIRQTVAGIPNTFTLGEVPVLPGQDPANAGAAVEKIVSQRAGQLSTFPEACFIIHFVNSNTRRLIPAKAVVDLAYENDKEEKKKEVVPSLPEE